MKAKVYKISKDSDKEKIFVFGKIYPQIFRFSDMSIDGILGTLKNNYLIFNYYKELESFLNKENIPYEISKEIDIDFDDEDKNDKRPIIHNYKVIKIKQINLNIQMKPNQNLLQEQKQLRTKLAQVTKQINLQEVSRMQQIAGINENSNGLTDENKQYLEREIESFLNNSLYNSDLLSGDDENDNPTLEEQAIRFIIQTLEERIDYY